MKLRKKSDITALIFDMGGVLDFGIELPPEKPLSEDIHVRISKNLGIGLDTWIDAIDSVYGKSIEGKLSPAKVKSIISKNLNIPRAKLEKIIIGAYRKFLRRNKELYGYALQKKKEGCKIAILSDQWYFSKKAIFNGNRFIKKFDSVVVSCDVGMRKPNPKIYRLVLKKLKIRPSEAVFTDNREWNLKPAKKLGMKTVLFKNNKQAIKEIEKLLK